MNQKEATKPAQGKTTETIPNAPTGEQLMKIKIYAPFKVYYDDFGASISAENDTGPFDILPHHRNFMTLLSPCEINVRYPGKEDFKIKVTRAVMHVKADKVVVFLDV